jgi:hypothetical protein
MGQKLAAFDASRTIVAFYDDTISPAPDGANTIELTDAQYRMLLDGQATGRRMAVDDDNAPTLLDRLPPSDSELAEVTRAARDQALTATDWIVARHQDETLLGAGTTLTAEQFSTLLTYRKALRELPEAEGWPHVDLPAAPDFVTAIAV